MRRYILTIMKYWHFFDKVYRRWVVLMIGPLDDFRNQLEADGFNDMDFIKMAKGMCIEMNPDNNTAGQYCNIIWMPVFETATLIHELTHMVMMQFDQVGIPISRNNTESFAFYTEYWFNEISRGRRRYPKGRSSALCRKGL